MMRPSVDSAATVNRINASRQRLSGINQVALPAGRAMTLRNGSTSVTAEGMRYNVRRDGTLSQFSVGTDRATFNHDGRLTTLRTQTIYLRNLAHGQRVISRRLEGGSTLVSTGRRIGYLQRTVERDGRTLTERSYITGDRTYTRDYLKTNYKGLFLKQYVPSARFSAGFYGWAYAGWRRPILYSWGWNRAPWYVYYLAYFRPWPSYAGANFWLTDWLFSETLEDGYGMQEAQDGDAAADMTAPDASAEADGSGAPTVNESIVAAQTASLGADVKGAIADQIQDQLLADDAAASAPPAADGEGAEPGSSDLERVMQPGYLFVVSSPLNVVAHREASPATGAAAPSCTLSPGDVIGVTALPDVAPAPSNAMLVQANSSSMTAAVRIRPAVMEVRASLGGDCAVGASVNVSPVDLQEMQNNLRASLEDGLRVLAASRAGNGLPPAPAGSVVTDERSDAVDPALGAMLQALPQQAQREQAQLLKAMTETQPPADH